MAGSRGYAAAMDSPDASLTFIGTATTVLRLGSFTLLTDPNFVRRGQRVHLGYGLTSKRRTDPALTPAQLAEYAGNYRNDEVEATHTWKVEKGQLVLYANDRRLGVIEPAYKDGFTRGGAVIDVQRDARGRIAGFVLESGRVRHLRFTRVR